MKNEGETTDETESSLHCIVVHTCTHLHDYQTKVTTNRLIKTYN